MQIPKINLIIKLLLTYLILVGSFFLILVLINSIPSNLLKKNIGISLNTLDKEGSYSTYGITWRKIVRDSFTDNLMLNEAFSVDSSQPIKSALQSAFSGGLYDTGKQTSSLEQLYLGKETKPVPYDRYWHGYLVYLRPLLAITSYQGIRTILTTVLICLGIWLLYLLVKRFGYGVALTILTGLLAVDFLYIGQSIQFFGVFNISILGSIYLLYVNNKNDFHPIYFFIIGAVTSFIDLLTAPLVTLSIPLIISTIYNRRKIKAIFISCIFWTLGYLSLWMSKWLLGQFSYSPGAITNAVNQIRYQTATNLTESISRSETIYRNFWQLIGYDKTNKYVVLAIGLTMFFFLVRYYRIPKDWLIKILPWLIIVCIPYIWYLVAAGHDYMHVWFTYRNQLMTVISASLIYLEFIDRKKFKKDIRRLKTLINR